jgi:hypothetical protein
VVLDIVNLVLNNNCVFFLSKDFATDRILMRVWHTSRTMRTQPWVLYVDEDLDTWPEELKVQEVSMNFSFGLNWKILKVLCRLTDEDISTIRQVFI